MVKCVAMKDQNLINIQKTKRSWRFSILLHNIIILLVLFLIYSCDNIYSVYNTKIINNEKICVHTYLENNYSRRFLKSLKENPHINEMPNCDYLLVVAIEGDYNTVNNVAGVRLENKVKLNAKYSLFKYEDKKYHQVKDILENPTIRSFEQYTSNKNASLSKGRSLATNEKVEKTFDSVGLQEIYKTTKERLQNHLSLIGGGMRTAEMVYMTNNLLLSSLEQGQTDAENQLATSLAQTILNSAILDILDFYKEQEQRECLRLYNNNTTANKNTNNTNINEVRCRQYWQEYSAKAQKENNSSTDTNKHIKTLKNAKK